MGYIDFNAITTIVLLLFSSGLVIAIKNLAKDIKDLVREYNEARADGSISEEEEDIIMEKLKNVIENGFKVGKMILDIFRKFRKFRKKK